MVGVLIAAFILLSLEKLCYSFIYNNPTIFQSTCGFFFKHYSVIDCFYYLFILLKIIQMGVFIFWFSVTGTLNFAHINWLACILGLLLLGFGQLLNISVFRSIGKVGIFYGKKFGYETPWVTRFPYSFLKHPQYVGAILSVWGFFLIMNYPYQYWYALPIIETVLYILNAGHEN